MTPLGRLKVKNSVEEIWQFLEYNLLESIKNNIIRKLPQIPSHRAIKSLCLVVRVISTVRVKF